MTTFNTADTTNTTSPEETTVNREYSPTVPVTLSADPYTGEIRWIAAAYLATLAALNPNDIEATRREGLQANLRTLEEVLAHNCSLPLESAGLILLNALPKTRAEFKPLIAQHGEPLNNPAPFADVYADNVVELERITQTLKTGPRHRLA